MLASNSMCMQAPLFLQSEQWECTGGLLAAEGSPAYALEKLTVTGDIAPYMLHSVTLMPKSSGIVPEIQRTAILKGSQESEQPPSFDSLIHMLEKGSENKSFCYAMHIYLLLCNYGLDNHRWLVNYIVPMFVECGGVITAQKVSSKSSDCNEYSWTSLIQGFLDFGEPCHAFYLYEKMQQGYIHPSEYTYVALMKACGKQKYVERSYEIHTEIVMKGLENEAFVGNAVVRMYARRSALRESWDTLDRISIRDVISWNSLLAGYCELGLIGEVLEILQKMQHEGVCADGITYVTSIKACASRKHIEYGQLLHTQVIKNGLERDDNVSSTIFDMYARCGLLLEAHHLFDGNLMHDLICWNSLVVGNVENGRFPDSLELLDEMEKSGISPDCSTYICGLKACSMMKTLDRGQKIQIDIVKKGYESDDYVGSTLVAMYSKCGAFFDARKIFDELRFHDLVSWTALIGGYVEYGRSHEALVCFDMMRLDRICPCELLFANTLKACSKLRDSEKGRELHAELAKVGFENDTFIGSIIVDMYANCGSLLEAQHVFDKFFVRDTVLWTSLISGYVEYGFAEEALKCFQNMLLQDVYLDATVFSCILQACKTLRFLERGQEIHSEIMFRGFEDKEIVGNMLIDMYGECGALEDAKVIFDKLSVQDIVSWNILLAAYTTNGMTERALALFQEMQVLGMAIDGVSWSSVIMGYADQGQGNRVFSFFAQMLEQGTLPNDIILLGLLRGCGDPSCFDIGRRIHAQVCQADGVLVFNELNLTTSIIEMYSKCGYMIYAQELLDATTSTNVGMWDALIRGYTHKMEADLVFSLFERMIIEGIQPDAILFLNVLHVCSHLGLMDVAESILRAMIEDFGIQPNFKHYTCLVDLLARAGRLHEAVIVIEKASLRTNSIVWCMILDSCQKWRNVDVGRWAFDSMMDFQGSAPFILMSNIYADAGRYEEAREIEGMMAVA